MRGPTGLMPYCRGDDNREDPKADREGERVVLNARLADARFFDEDVRETLESRLPQLARLTFQDRLGDYRQKTARLEELSQVIAHAVGRPDLVDTARAAARLSKADLTTRMVKEFTDLQGVVGGIYARREGQPDSVWKAIYDQYRPAAAGGDPPREAAGATSPLADRFDTLPSLQIGLVPTGSKDPYGLRRTAFGAVSIILAQGWRIDWKPVLRGPRASGRRARRRAGRNALRRSNSSSRNGCATSSSGAGRRTTRSRPSPARAPGTSRTWRTGRTPSRRRESRWISAR